MADRKTVIVLVFGCEPIGVYGSLKDMCNKNKGFVYSTVIRKENFPFEYKKRMVYKITFR